MATTQDNKALVRRYYDEVFNQRRPELVDQLAVVDYVEHDPFPGQGSGIADLKARVQLILDAMNPVHFTIEDILAEDDRVVVRWSQQATQTGPFMGIPPTGRTATFNGIDVHRLRDGRIAEHWHVVDLFALLQQLGAIPAPSGAA
ncbi:MAG: ester cyclase [Candidatus Dormibacteria bacterium]